MFSLLINLLPFTIGRNILETTLLSKEEIYGFTIFDLKHFVALYLSDLFLLLIYQNYFSKKFSKKEKKSKISKSFKLALISLSSFLLLVMLRSINHEFGTLLILGSFIIVKYILLFSIPIVIDLKKNKNIIYQTIASITFFQSFLVLYEQLKGGNIGKFIENRLPGIDIGTRASEAADMLRADGTFNEPNITAIFLLMNSVLLINLALKNFRKNKKLNYFYLLISLLSLFTIIFTGSRSLYALSFIFLIFTFFEYKKTLLKISKKIFRKNIFKLIALITLAIALPYFVVRMSSFKNVLSETGSFSYRKELNNHVLSISSKELLGIGLDLTPYYLAKNFKAIDSKPVVFDPAPAHNILVQILAETGILALLLFLSFTYFSFRKSFNGKNKDFAIAALVYFIAAQFHPVFSNHYELTAFFFLYLGMALND